MSLYIDVLDLSQNRYGSGPLTQITYWQSRSKIDAAGTFEFEVAANDAQRAELQALRIVRAYAWLDGAWTEIGSGIIERVERKVAANGAPMLRVSGADMLREFAAHVTIPAFQQAGGGAMTHAQAVNLVRQLPIFDGYTYSLWGGTPDPTPPNDVIKFATNQESCLFTARRVAEISGNHFYLSGFRALTYASTFTSSGVRAIQPDSGPLNAETCAILQLTISSDTTEFTSRVYPRGGGNGTAEMALRHTTRTAPTGYTLDKSRGFLQYDALHAIFPSSRKVGFKELRPLSNSTADIQAADDALFDSALAWLRQHAETYNAPVYRLAVGQCRQLLRPMQTIRLSYRAPDAGIIIEHDLNILEATIRVDADGLRTTEMVVSAGQYLPESAGQVLAESVQQGQIYSSMAQPDVNSYAQSMRGQLDSDNNCTFVWRLGNEITQIQGVYLDFRIVPLEDATEVALAAETGTDGPTATGTDGPTATGVGGPTTTGTDGPTATANGGPTATGTGGPTTTANGGTTTTANGGPATTHNGGPTATGNDGGGGATTGGSHNHNFGISGVATTQGYPLALVNISGFWYIVAIGMTGNIAFDVSTDNTHQHQLPAHQHGIDQHQHGIDQHQHGIDQHSHTVTQHSHTVTQHSHTVTQHSHIVAQHSHTVAQHSHSVAQHSHDAPELTVTHKPWRNSGLTLGVDTLSHRINSGAWVTGVVDLGGGWHRVDLTETLVDAALRPITVLNTIEFKTTSQYAGIIEAQLTVRCSIMAVDF